MSTSTSPAATRTVLIVVHTGRLEAVHSAIELVTLLAAAGITPVVIDGWAAPSCHQSAPAAQTGDAIDPQHELARSLAALDPPVALLHTEQAPEAELVIVLGGDGTILRAAELVRDTGTPLLGVNLGHVGFLAESEREELPEAVDRIVSRSYEVEQRQTVDVIVTLPDGTTETTWALNEATVEKACRERMLEVTIAVDDQPLSNFGCDGVVISTSTGSTAHAFSAGGPVVWPDVDALLLVPLSAHALFARPLVVGPGTTLGVELMTRTDARGILTCDGRRIIDLPPGARVTVRRSSKPVQLARLVSASFTERLVKKFDLPVSGWRGRRSTQ